MDLDGALTVDGNPQHVLEVPVAARALVLTDDEVVMHVPRADAGRPWRLRYSLGHIAK